MHPPSDAAPVPEASRPAAITKLLVKALTEIAGRGPTNVRTQLSPSVITVVMRDTLTRAERTLVADGEAELVIAMRRAFHRTIAPVVGPGIEAITGERVFAALSDHHVAPDVSVWIFVLAQRGDDGAAAPELVTS